MRDGSYLDENKYLSEKAFPILRENHVVISGCSGGGKSSLLSELASRGYPIVYEPGRQIVKEQAAIGGDALPWFNLDKFLDLALSRYVYLYNIQASSDSFIFFDRGIIDAVKLTGEQPEYFKNAAKTFRYHRKVFLVPPWEEIFKEDSERKFNFSKAKEEFDELILKYNRFDYETVLIPKAPLQERAEFVLKALGVG